METLDGQAQFVRAILALRPYLDDIVVAGAWAHRLLRLHRLAQAPGHEPLMTLDVDLAAPAQLATRGRSIRALLGDADFQESFRGGESDAASYFHLGDDAGGFKI